MTMTITFTGTAAEVREEMKILLGRSLSSLPLSNLLPELNIDQQVEAAFGEPKRGRGRPKKSEAPAGVEDTPVVVEDTPVVVEDTPVVVEDTPVVITYTPEDQAAAKAALEVLKEVIVPAPEPTPEPEPVAEQPGLPVPSNAQDLMNAAMEIVKGDSGKKIALVKLLQSYGAKTINTLGAEHYPEFWVKVNEL